MLEIAKIIERKLQYPCIHNFMSYHRGYFNCGYFNRPWILQLIRGYFNCPWLLQLSVATSIVVTSIVHGYFNRSYFNCSWILQSIWLLQLLQSSVDTSIDPWLLQLSVATSIMATSIVCGYFNCGYFNHLWLLQLICGYFNRPWLLQLIHGYFNRGYFNRPWILQSICGYFNYFNRPWLLQLWLLQLSMDTSIDLWLLQLLQSSVDTSIILQSSVVTSCLCLLLSHLNLIFSSLIRFYFYFNFIYLN